MELWSLQTWVQMPAQDLGRCGGGGGPVSGEPTLGSCSAIADLKFLIL